MTTHNIHADSTKDEIVAALRAEGFDSPEGGATQQELLELLSTVTGADYSKRQAPAKAKSTRKKSTAAAAEETKKILIPSGDTAVNQGDIFVQVNGRAFQIKRDVEVEVPQPVVEVLQQAKTTVGRQMDDGSVSYHKVPTYAFSIVA